MISRSGRVRNKVQLKSKTRKSKGKILPLMQLFIPFTIFFLAIILWFCWPPNLFKLKHKNPDHTRLMEIRSEEANAANRLYKIKQTWVPLDRISPHLRHAVLVAEDAKFYQHHGVDWEALQNSAREAIRRKKFSHGGSTITQQVAKNLYLSLKKSPFRKLKEIEIALLMEQILTKQRIMEIYLNVAEWGNGVFGAEEASRKYFGKSAADLTPGEAAALAATLPSPLRYSPVNMSAYVAGRRAWILKWMGRSGFLPPPTLMTNPPTIFSPSDELVNEQDQRSMEEEDEEEGEQQEQPQEQTQTQSQYKVKRQPVEVIEEPKEMPPQETTTIETETPAAAEEIPAAAVPKARRRSIQ